MERIGLLTETDAPKRRERFNPHVRKPLYLTCVSGKLLGTICVFCVLLYYLIISDNFQTSKQIFNFSLSNSSALSKTNDTTSPSTELTVIFDENPTTTESQDNQITVIIINGSDSSDEQITLPSADEDQLVQTTTVPTEAITNEPTKGTTKHPNPVTPASENHTASVHWQSTPEQPPNKDLEDADATSTQRPGHSINETSLTTERQSHNKDPDVIDAKSTPRPQHNATVATPGTKAKTIAPPVVPKSSVIKGFLVWTPECQIPDLDPFAPSIRMSFNKKVRPKCLQTKQLTEISIEEATGKPILNFKRNLTTSYSPAPLSCCYSEIIRFGSGNSIDKKFKFTNCTNFNKTIHLDPTLGSILVTCKNEKKSTVYKNIHVLIPQKESVRKRLESWQAKNESSRPPSVILFGIDSISRMNLIRTMPLTTKFVQNPGWFEMAGYNKIADNTFPNLMALLTGYNSTTAYRKCNPKKVGGLDSCSFLWNEYEKAGYVTAYSEDAQGISTFNYIKVGFKKQPTDCYLRPVMLAAESTLTTSNMDGLKFCLGYQSAPEYVYNYISQVRNAYKGHPFFGLFWTNTFSHNSYYAPTSMDSKILEYFQTFNSSGILNESIILFFSDHGMRFGYLRQSSTGHLEERLPFFYIWLPPSFREKHPEIVQALKINKNRLTNPFDVHVTLKHLLELTGRATNLPKAEDCPNCQSLFKTVPESRSCEDAAIEDHWCTCRAFHNVNKNSPKVKEATLRTIEYINDIVKHANNGTVAHLCTPLVLKTITYANQEVIPHVSANSTLEGYQISFSTNPGGAMFETTVRIDKQKFEVTGTISRLNSYEKQAKCVNVEAVKKYCACKK